MKEYAKGLVLLTLVGVFTSASWLVSQLRLPSNLSQAGAVLAWMALVCGFPIYIKAFRFLLQRKITVQLFVTIAIAVSIGSGNLVPAATVVFIILAGTTLEDYILYRTRGAIERLIQLSPKTARVIRDNEEVEIPADQVDIGELVLVKPGEKIPIDGLVISGHSSVNQATITGESLPVEKAEGDNVFAGTLNEYGVLKVKAERISEDTTLAHIISLVEEAQEKKAPIQNIADRFTTYFLPFILALASLVYAISYLTVGSGEAVTRAVSILLVACPCALALAVPIAIVGAIGNASMKGIIIKGGTHIQKVKDVDVVAFDKTGTLTVGQPRVVNVETVGDYSQYDLITFAAVAEKFSEHPLSKAIISKAGELGVNPPDPEDFEAIPGHGVKAHYGSKEILIGSKALAKENVEIPRALHKIINELEADGKTATPVAVNREVIGVIAIADTVRADSAKSLSRLKRLGIKTIMMTGDNKEPARAIATQMGMDGYEAELLPEQKVEYIKKLKRDHIVAMVGDGVNDAPALASADVGFAMGAAGSDVAIDTADVVLLGDDLTKVEYSIRLSRKAFKKMRANIAFSIMWNVLGLSLASLGFLTPILAAFLQEAGCISVVINSALLLIYK